MSESYTVARNVATSIHERNEIVLHVPNDLDLLARLFGVLATLHRSVMGWCFYSDRERVTVIVIAANGNAARRLETAGFECVSNPVIVLPHQPRCFSISQLSAELRCAGVDVLDIHACGSRQDGPLFVLKTNDKRQALQILETMDLFCTEATDLPVAQPMEAFEPAIK